MGVTDIAWETVVSSAVARPPAREFHWVKRTAGKILPPSQLDNPVPSEFDGVRVLRTPGESTKRRIPDSMMPEKEE
jgi:hypothetical protein